MFRPNSLGHLVSRLAGRSRCEIFAEIHNVLSLSASFSTKSSDMLLVDQVEFKSPLSYNPLFIPTNEVLSLFPGFALALENKDFAFDETYLDIAKKLAAVPLKGGRQAEVKDLLKQLQDLIEGDIFLENSAFYLRSHKKSAKLEAQLMGEGSRKLAMLLYLLKTGELTKGCTLFWDEPEANLNPRFVKNLARILAPLSKTIQICIATHSLFLLREFDILMMEDKELTIRFFGLTCSEGSNNVSLSCGDCIDDIHTIVALDEAIVQSQRYQKAQYNE